MTAKQIQVAEKIIKDYCQVIQISDPTLYGIPESYLVYKKPQIKQAIITALRTLAPDEIDFRESLIHSYLHLAQFIPDEQADIVKKGQAAILSGDIHHPDFPIADEALHIINGIKADMEELKIEIQDYLLKNLANKYE